MAFSGEDIGVLKSTTALDELEGRFQVGMIRWTNAAAVDGELEITDGVGRVYFYSVADGPNFNDLHPLFKQMDGIIVSKLSSGTLLIYLR